MPSPSSSSSSVSTAPPTHPACLSLLQSCSSMTNFLQIHAQMLRNHLFHDPFAATKLLQFAVDFPLCTVHYARKLFEQISHPNTFAWNTIIRGFAGSPFPAPSLCLFRRMLRSDARPNAYTYPFLLKACAHLSALKEGQQFHAFMLKCAGDRDVFSVNGLIHMYAFCGRVDHGFRVFTLSDERDTVTWNCMLSGYISCGLLDRAKHVFNEMPDRGIVSCNAMINGYAKSGDLDEARKLFDGMPDRNMETWNTLIAGYAKGGQLDMAQKLFDEMPVKNSASWSAMITAYAQGDCPNQALVLFEEMKKLAVMPNCAAIVSVLSACSHLGALESGRKVHAYIESNKMKLDSILGTALIDMYSKTGCINRALEVFERLVPKDVFSWTAMIGGLALNGHEMKALKLFSQMEADGVMPNEITFVGVLCACSHAGLVELAKKYFDSMRMVYGLVPQVEHYGCLVDVLGRSGHLEDAVSLVQGYPNNNAFLWGTLLGACRIHGNADIGEVVVNRLVELKPDDGGVYVLLSNIYAMRGRWDDARKIRMLMNSKGLEKTPGQSSVEVCGVVHEFCAGDRSHKDTLKIYDKLAEILSNLKLAEHQSNTAAALFDIDEEEKEQALAYHSEKLAIAYGLINH